MNASASRRVIAYIIDFIFIMAILMILSYFIPKNNNLDSLNNDINNLTEEVLDGDINFKEYTKKYSIYLASIDKENIIYNTISTVITIVYYVIIPLIFNTTLGKYIMKLEIKNKRGKKLNIFNTFVRSIINVGLLYSLVTVFLVQIVSSEVYLFTLIIFGIIQIILVILSLFMILYRHDKCGLQDILSNSNVVLKEVKE